jgi:putative component of toxin-antitoxin plasmid stabilization module
MTATFLEDRRVVILLVGGGKSNQDRDIRTAREVI